MYAENFRLNGIQKDYYPPVAPIAPDVVEASFDADGNLMMRGATLTDEGTFRVNFANSSLRVGIGTCTFTNGSDIVTGTAFNTYDVKAGDYVNIDGHAESTLVQIDTITPTQIILETPYTGATTTGVASRQIVRSFTGTGATISVASGSATIAGGTTASAVTVLGRFVDVAPLVYRAGLSISQRIINQTINIGLNDEGSPTKWFARFQADGTINTTIKCQTARNPTIAPTGNEIQETVVTIPNGLTTAASLEYRVELLTEEVVFYINNIRVANHTRVIPNQYDTMGAGIAVLNGATPPATNTNIILDYITCKNHNKLEIGVMSANESIQATQVPLTPFSFSQAGVIAINTDLLIIDCAQLKTVNLQATSIGTTGRLDFFLTNDLSVTGTAQPAYPIGGAAAVVNTTTAGHWNIPTNGSRFLRIRLGVATTAGTTTLFAAGSQFAMPLPLPTTQPVSATNLSANIAQVGGTNTVNGGVAGILSVGGNVAHSAASTANPLQTGGRIVPISMGTVDTTLVAGDVSYTPISTGLQTIIKPFGTSELDYSHAVLPNVTTMTVQSIVAASGTSSVRNYITQYSVQTDTLGAAGNMFILDNQGAIGTSVTIATPGVFTSTAHDLKIGDCIIFTAIGTITGISTNTMYYITGTSFAATTFTIALTPGGTAIAITGSTSAFTFYRVFNMFRLNTAALATPVIITPQNPYRGIANANLNVYFPTSLTSGAVYLNVNGYKGF